MNGLDLANQWIDETQRPGLLKKTETERSAMVKIAEGMEKSRSRRRRSAPDRTYGAMSPAEGP